MNTLIHRSALEGLWFSLGSHEHLREPLMAVAAANRAAVLYSTGTLPATDRDDEGEPYHALPALARPVEAAQSPVRDRWLSMMRFACTAPDGTCFLPDKAWAFLMKAARDMNEWEASERAIAKAALRAGG